MCDMQDMWIDTHENVMEGFRLMTRLLAEYDEKFGCEVEVVLLVVNVVHNLLERQDLVWMIYMPQHSFWRDLNFIPRITRDGFEIRSLMLSALARFGQCAGRLAWATGEFPASNRW